MRQVDIPDYLWLKVERRSLMERTDISSFVMKAIEERLGLANHPEVRRRRHRAPSRSR